MAAYRAEEKIEVMKCGNCRNEAEPGETFCPFCKDFCEQHSKIIPFSGNPMFPSAARVVFDPVNFGVIAIKTKRDDAS